MFILLMFVMSITVFSLDREPEQKSKIAFENSGLEVDNVNLMIEKFVFKAELNKRLQMRTKIDSDEYKPAPGFKNFSQGFKMNGKIKTHYLQKRLNFV